MIPAGIPLHCAAQDGVAPVELFTAADKILVFRPDVVSVFQHPLSPQLAAQVLPIHPDTQLEQLVCVIAQPVIQVVIGDGSPHTKGDLAAKIGEQIHLIVVVVLHNSQRAVKGHPMDQVRELAHAAAHPLPCGAIADGHARPVALPGRAPPHHAPKGKSLPWGDDHPVDTGRGQRQVDRFVFLQLHIHLAQPAADQRLVPVDQHRQRFCHLPLGKRPPGKILQFAAQDLLFY